MFKDIAEKMQEKEKGKYLNNMSEKKDLSYTDNTIPSEDPDQDIKEIADYYEKEWENHRFSSDDDPGLHFFLDLPDEIQNKLGDTRICICPYKGFPHEPWLDSNYMWYENDTYTTLYIDIYGCEDRDKKYIHDAVIRELYNFTRDAEWVLDGVYESKMLEMKEENDKIGMTWIETNLN